MAWGTSSQNRECPGTVGTYMYMYDVGQHPLVNRLLKGVFHLRPPQPQHTQTWDVGLVTCNCKLFQIKRWEEITTVSRSNSQTCSAYDINKAIEINWSWSLYLHRSSYSLKEWPMELAKRSRSAETWNRVLLSIRWKIMPQGQCWL